MADLPSFHGIIGRSAAMRTLFRKVELAAPADVPILIQGESGTGKDLVARVIQRLSARSGRAFEALNCADLTRELLRSELFGHERGAFSGAFARTSGIVALADGGTVFLDEVGELAPEAQAMLLRFLETGEGRPVGSTKTVRADVRLIAATHRGMDRGGGTGTIRLDLYYRLRGVLLEMPALRERAEDIPLLVEHYRRAINERHQRLGVAIEGVRPRAMSALQTYDWPGNVRELASVLEEAMILQRTGWLELEDLGIPASRERPAFDGRNGEALTFGDLTWPQREGLRIAAARGEVQRHDLMERCGISTEAARRTLVSLVHLGRLRRLGGGRGVRYVPHGEAQESARGSADDNSALGR
jgi:DNA-binding NtrC family response regulator